MNGLRGGPQMLHPHQHGGGPPHHGPPHPAALNAAAVAAGYYQGAGNGAQQMHGGGRRSPPLRFGANGGQADMNQIGMNGSIEETVFLYIPNQSVGAVIGK